MEMDAPIYLDHNATTPVDPRVLKKMLPYFTEIFGNASSIDHIHGHQAKKATQHAREKIAKCLGCRKDSEIIFTSGATESNNLALIGTYRKHKNKGNHIISSAIEHPSVLETLEYLKNEENAEVTLLPVDKYGTVKINEFKNAIRENTILVSIMFANNEIGTIQPIKEIGEFVKSKNVLFHTDAAQAVGHEKINVYNMNVDLMSFSAHKFYGPKGVGGLFVRSFSPYVKLSPISYGGGHERGLRAGTLNVPSVVGMAEALNFSIQEMDETNEKNFKSSQNFLKKMAEVCPEMKLNGHPQKRIKHNINVTIPGIENKALIHLVKDKLSFATGSACSTTKVMPSHVLKAIGISENKIFKSIRISLGKLSANDGYEDILLNALKIK